MVHDPYLPQTNNGDIDDLMAMYAYNGLFKKIKINIYVPHELFNGETRANLLRKFDDFHFEIFDKDTMFLKEIVRDAFAIGLMAPLTDHDSKFIEGLKMRNDNSINFCQGELKDYNLSACNVSEWKYKPGVLINGINVSGKIDPSIIDRLFPIKMNSELTNRPVNLDRFLKKFTVNENAKNHMYTYTVKKCICVPSPKLKFSAGLFCEEFGKANNYKKIIEFLELNHYIVDIKNMVFTDEERENVYRWVTEYSNTHNITTNLDKLRYRLFQVVSVIKLFFGVEIVDEFPKLDSFSISKNNMIFPDPSGFDFMAVMLYLNSDTNLTDPLKIYDEIIHKK